jgi:hypothetical protein
MHFKLAPKKCILNLKSQFSNNNECSKCWYSVISDHCSRYTQFDHEVLFSPVLITSLIPNASDFRAINHCKLHFISSWHCILPIEKHVSVRKNDSRCSSPMISLKTLHPLFLALLISFCYWINQVVSNAAKIRRPEPWILYWGSHIHAPFCFLPCSEPALMNGGGPFF